MEEEKKEIKEVKSYSLPPSQIAWLRKRALSESTPEKTVSASAVLERIIDEAMQKDADQPSPSNQKKRNALSARQIALVA